VSDARRLALLGDVHGNGPALEAVLQAVREAGIDRGAITGDLVMRGSEPEECVSRVRSLRWPCVAGNVDRKVADHPARPPGHPATRRPGSRSWTRLHLTEESVRFLAELPLVVRLELGGHRIAVMHAAPADPALELGADHLAAVARALDVACVVSGHTHRPVIRRVDGRLLVNPGSVGEGVGDDRRPSWAWLAATPDGLRAALERVERPLARRRQPL
jgi:putative phosphoesterase